MPLEYFCIAKRSVVVKLDIFLVTESMHVSGRKSYGSP